MSRFDYSSTVLVSEMGYFETASAAMTLLVVIPSTQRHRMDFKPLILLSAEILA